MTEITKADIAITRELSLSIAKEPEWVAADIIKDKCVATLMYYGVISDPCAEFSMRFAVVDGNLLIAVAVIQANGVIGVWNYYPSRTTLTKTHTLPNTYDLDGITRDTIDSLSRLFTVT